MKYLSFLRKPLWLSLTVLAGYTPAMTGSSSAYIPSATYMDFTKQLESESNDFSLIPSHFPRPAGLTSAVNFWRQVFGDWRAHQIALHDDKYLGVVYDVVEITGYIGGRLSAEQQAKVNQRKKQLIGQLNDLEYRVHKRMGLTKEEQRLYTLITSNGGKKALHEAAQRVRIQRGMKESFQTGLKASSRYDALMREVFHKNTLPEELAHLPHVESAFTTSARSPAGAVGVWQFMPVTGKRYLRMDKSMDERYDPILATSGAAKYLAYAYERLGDWGLAITSYNHGLSGMLRARQEHGKDIVKIIDKYDGASFGFASRNYYAEFLAVCDIMADLPRYFPKTIDYQARLPVKQVAIAQELTSGEIARKFRVNYKKLAELNPAWTKEAADGQVALPANSAIWVPDATAKAEPVFETPERNEIVAAKVNETDAISSSDSNTQPPPLDTLKEFPNGISGQLQTETIRLAGIEQILKAAKPKRPQNKTHEVHIVKSGDSPYTIASKYSVHLRELLTINDIDAGSLIRPGQSILIPSKTNS